MSFGFGSRLTLLGKRLLIIYSIIYILELICEHWLNIPVVAYLPLYPLNTSAFGFWQLITHPFIHNPYYPFSFLLHLIGIYFFAAPVEYAFGTKRFLALFYISAIGAAICGLAFSYVLGFHAPFLGMSPSVLALVVVFGLINPEATILFMFVLPIKAKYISYGTVVLVLLTLLAKYPYGAYHLGGILFGYIYFKGPRKLLHPGSIYLKFLQWQYKRKKSRFGVIDGGNKKDDDTPTYH